MEPTYEHAMYIPKALWGWKCLWCDTKQKTKGGKPPDRCPECDAPAIKAFHAPEWEVMGEG